MIRKIVMAITGLAAAAAVLIPAAASASQPRMHIVKTGTCSEFRTGFGQHRRYTETCSVSMQTTQREAIHVYASGVNRDEQARYISVAGQCRGGVACIPSVTENAMVNLPFKTSLPGARARHYLFLRATVEVTSRANPGLSLVLYRN